MSSTMLARPIIATEALWGAVATEAQVESTVRALREHRFDVEVVQDAAAAVRPSSR